MIPPLVWLLIDDRAGNRSQVMGVAQVLGLPYIKQELEYTAAGALPNMVLGASFHGLTKNSRINLAPPWPDLAIAAGRRTAPVARYIKEKSGGKTFLCQIMYPGETGIDDFDLVAVPHHDRVPPLPNFLPITGAPHPVTPQRLAESRQDWEDRLEPLPRPRIALIVGGSTKRREFTAPLARELGEKVAAMARKTGGSLLVTTSRRTGEGARQALLEAIAGIPAHVFTWGDGGDNPYFGYLALADAIVVTGDSVSMCSEACATAAPVYIFAPKALTVHKHGVLHQELYAKGYARPLEEKLDAWSHEPLNAATPIAAEIRRRLGLV
ncbi:MAG: mitochondrial fission ELM1 family protein [Magnetospirillum sp. WYHS-4]